jgi:hypothetical protein
MLKGFLKIRTIYIVYNISYFFTDDLVNLRFNWLWLRSLRCRWDTRDLYLQLYVCVSMHVHVMSSWNRPFIVDALLNSTATVRVGGARGAHWLHSIIHYRNYESSSGHSNLSLFNISMKRCFGFLHVIREI